MPDNYFRKRKRGCKQQLFCVRGYISLIAVFFRYAPGLQTAAQPWPSIFIVCSINGLCFLGSLSVFGNGLGFGSCSRFCFCSYDRCAAALVPQCSLMVCPFLLMVGEPYPLARNQYINNSPGILSCICACANTGAACIRTEWIPLRIWHNTRENDSSKIFSCIRASANTGPACIRAKINSPRIFSCMYWFCAGGYTEKIHRISGGGGKDRKQDQTDFPP